jgi:hypothetical protein
VSGALEGTHNPSALTDCSCANCQADRLQAVVATEDNVIVSDTTASIVLPSAIPSEQLEVIRAKAKDNPNFHFEYDATNKIVRGKFHGDVTPESLKDYYLTATALVHAKEFRAAITDFTDVISLGVTLELVRELAALPPIDANSSRTRIIVAPGVLVFGLARLFQWFGKEKRPNLHIVRNLDQALAILGIAEAHFNRIQ